MTLSLTVTGANGRLGRRIVALALDSGVTLKGAVVRDGSAAIGMDAGVLAGMTDAGVRCTKTLAVAAGDVVVICAPRTAALEHAAIAAGQGAAFLVATTGFTKQEQATLEAHAARVPMMIAPNLSLGVAVLRDLVARAAKQLAGYQIEVLEMHHDQKRDAPSGTAWSLARTAAEARGRDIERDAICARAGETGPRGSHEIGMMSLRGGNVVGDHTVFFVSPHERLELTHRAQDRDVFAAGALHAARFLAARAPGCYMMRDTLAAD